MPPGVESRLAFPGADSVWALGHVGAVVVAVLVIVRLFAWERQLVPRRVGWTLLLLRAAGLIVVLLALFQPTWAWVIRREETGRVLIALDVSESMLTTDPQASTAERLGWAVGLGWLDRNVLPTEPVPEGGPQGVPAGLDPRVWSDVNIRLLTLTRGELARRLLTEGRRPLLTALEPLGTLEREWFAGVASPVAKDTWSAPLTTSPQDVLPEATRLDAALKSAVAASGNSRVLGLILLTDGRDNAAADTLSAARQLAEASVPIYPVLIGSTRRPRDLSILSVDAPQSVYQGDKPKVRVQISTSGFTDIPVDVKLDRAEPDPNFPPQTQTITATSEPQVLEYELPAEALGPQKYVVTIAGQPDELRDDNNTRPFTIQVVDDRTRVLLVDGEPRWEFRYLEAALSRDERVNLDVVLFQQPYLAVLPSPFFPNDWPIAEEGQPESPFAERDMVVLGDVLPAAMAESDWKALETFVGEQGGTLVLVAGRAAMPLGHTSPVLASLLPITAPQRVLCPVLATAAPMLRGWTWSLTPDGERQTSLQFATPEDANRTIWGVLPGATSAIVGQPKPAATVWAWGRPPAGNNGPAVPLIVHQYFGLGQVVWIASDSTWRWRFRVGDQFHHRFWGQLARWAATTKLSAGNAFVQFGPLKTQYSLSESVELQARWATRKDVAQNPDDAVAEILRGEDVVARVALAPDPKRPRIAGGVAGKLPAGDYVARLTLGDAAGPPLDAPFSVLAPPSAELADVTANRELLQQLTDLTGGKLFEPATVADLPGELHPYTSRTELPQEQPLWDRWPAFLLLIGLLTAEWVVRRVNGLP